MKSEFYQLARSGSFGGQFNSSTEQNITVTYQCTLSSCGCDKNMTNPRKKKDVLNTWRFLKIINFFYFPNGWILYIYIYCIGANKR